MVARALIDDERRVELQGGRTDTLRFGGGLVWAIDNGLSRAEMRREALRLRILRAAEELFLREGLSSVTMDAIAAKAETTKATVYKYYQSKGALVTASVDYAISRCELSWREVVSKFQGAPLEVVVNFVNVVADEISKPSYRARLLVKLFEIFTGEHVPAKKVLEDYRKTLRERITGLCNQAGLLEPQKITAELEMILLGAALLVSSGSGQSTSTLLRSMANKVLRDAVARTAGSDPLQAFLDT